jgi:hypothetical protein
MMEPRQIITVPADWDTTKDKQGFVERYGPSETYRSDTLNELARDIKRFNQVLNDAIAYFARGLELTALMGPALTVQEKIDWLLKFVQDLDTSTAIRDRLLRNLDFCGWVESERHRLMTAGEHPFVLKWVEPLCVLSDDMVSAAIQLEESLVCEFRGYTATVYLKPKKDPRG